MYILSNLFFFFFQAEDGIRDLIVTGVHVCSSDLSEMGPASRDNWLRESEGVRLRRAYSEDYSFAIRIIGTRRVDPCQRIGLSRARMRRRDGEGAKTGECYILLPKAFGYPVPTTACRNELQNLCAMRTQIGG